MKLFDEIEAYILSKPFAILDFPFDDVTRVYKIGGKMFALIGETQKTINLKNFPEKNIELRSVFGEVKPGYHMNKTHWNTVEFSQELFPFILEWIDESYDIVLKSLTKKQKELLKETTD